LRFGSVHGRPSRRSPGADMGLSRKKQYSREPGRSNVWQARRGRAKGTAPPCRSSTLLHAVRMPHVVETYKERAAPAVENHSLSGEVDEAESLASFCAVSCPRAQRRPPAARRREPIRRLRARRPEGEGDQSSAAQQACVGLSAMALVANGLFRCASSAASVGTARLAIRCGAIGSHDGLSPSLMPGWLSAFSGTWYFAHVKSC
jgi:hypothetical protein